jgi:hypothetical protein
MTGTTWNSLYSDSFSVNIGVKTGSILHEPYIRYGFGSNLMFSVTSVIRIVLLDLFI